MRLEEVQNRVTYIEEEFNDLEVAYDRIYELYLDVLIAIANGQCEGARPEEFAKVAIGLERVVTGGYGGPEFWHELEERLAGRRPTPFPPLRDTPPAPPKKAPKKRTSKKRAAKSPPKTRKKRG